MCVCAYNLPLNIRTEAKSIRTLDAFMNRVKFHTSEWNECGESVEYSMCIGKNELETR